MKAKVRKSARQSIVVSCAGVVFTKDNWTNVPTDRENEARKTPNLELDESEEEAESASLNLDSKDHKTTKINATAGALKLAKEKGIDLSEVIGSGKKGRIQMPDVVKLIPSDVEDNATPDKLDKVLVFEGESHSFEVIGDGTTKES